MKLRRLLLNERESFNGYPLTLSVLSTDESRGWFGSSSVFFVLSFLPVAAAADGGSSAIPMAFLMSSSNEVREGMYVLLVTKSAGVSRGPSGHQKKK